MSEQSPAGEDLTRSTRSRGGSTRASLHTGIGTFASRITGLLRLVVLVYALGQNRLADAFNLANNTPNIVHDLVLGGVLAATFVPVFVDRIERRPRAEAVQSISAVVTLASVVLVVATIAFIILAPEIVDLYTLGSATPVENRIAVELLRFFAPQLLFYGAISLMSAVLATEDRFVAVGIAPVINNVVGIGVFALFAAFTRATRPAIENLTSAPSSGLVIFLGVGTTIGVALQAVALVPSLRRLSLRPRFIWRPRDEAIGMILRLSGWTFGFVVLNQVAVFIVLALAFHVSTGALSGYTYAYTFFQLPFGVVAVSIVNVATPDLARRFATGQLRAVGERLGSATRQILALILPAAAGYLVLAKPIVSLLLQHGAETGPQADLTGEILALFALGLPGFCVYLLAIRCFQAMQDTRTAFVLYALENGLNVLLAVILVHPLGARGLALSYAIAYDIAALVALAILRERLGTIGGRATFTVSLRAAILSVAMALVVALVAAVIGTGPGLFGWIRLLFEVGVGACMYLALAVAAGTASGWQTSRRNRGATRGGRPHHDPRRH